MFHGAPGLVGCVFPDHLIRVKAIYSSFPLALLLLLVRHPRAPAACSRGFSLYWTYNTLITARKAVWASIIEEAPARPPASVLPRISHEALARCGCHVASSARQGAALGGAGGNERTLATQGFRIYQDRGLLSVISGKPGRGRDTQNCVYTRPMLRGGIWCFFTNAKNTQTTAWRVLTEPTEHTCKALASVEAPTLRNTYDFSPFFF